MAIRLNESLSGIGKGSTSSNFAVVVDVDTREEADDIVVQHTAREYATANGYPAMNTFPVIVPIDAATGAPVEHAKMFSPDVRIGGFRVMYEFQRTI